MKRNQQEQKIFDSIAAFYIEKSGCDYDKAIKDVEQVGFRRIEVFGDNVVVWVKRVGLFIGRRGENVSMLEKHLSKKIYIKEVEAEVEDSIVCMIADRRDMAMDWFNWEDDFNWQREQDHYEEDMYT